MTPWVRNLISSSQTKASPTPIKIDKTMHLLPTWRRTKMNQIIGKKKWGQRVERQKVVGLTFALVVHQWFNNNKNILCYHRRHHGLQIPMTCPNLLAIASTIQHVWIFSCFNANNDFNVQKQSTMSLEV
jgi:hypothetical protein